MGLSYLTNVYFYNRANYLLFLNVVGFSFFFTHYFFLIILKYLNIFLVIFFFVHLLGSVFIFTKKYWKKIIFFSTGIVNYYILVNCLLILLLGYKFYFKYTYLQLLHTSYVFNSFKSSFFSDTIILLALLTTLISWFFLSERHIIKKTFFTFYFSIFMIITFNMVYTNNLLSMFVFFELLFVPSLFFVYKFGYTKKVNKTITYLLLWTLSGSLLVLCGLAYLFTITKTLQWGVLNTIKFSIYEKNVLFLIFFFGFGVKIPLWPFHYWLTKVHVDAPTGFSMFLSGYLVKTAFYCLTYFYFLFITPFTKIVTLVFIICGLLDASLRMWAVSDIKKLIAFATVQEMNLILLLFVLLNNSMLLLVNIFLLIHGVLSIFLFYLVDQVQKQSATRNIMNLSGFSYVKGLNLLIWSAILIFRGFPLFIKFFIEWELLTTLIINFDMFGFIIFFCVNFFGVLGFCRIWFIVLYGYPSTSIKSFTILKKDFTVGVFLVTILFLLNFCIYLF